LRKEKGKREEIFRDEMPIYSFFYGQERQATKKNRRVVKEVFKVCHEIKEARAFLERIFGAWCSFAVLKPFMRFFITAEMIRGHSLMTSIKKLDF